MKLYQIKDWSIHFENDRSRTRKHCTFVCVPNKQHGMGFSRIMSEPDGAAIYGVWHMILGACSQQTNRDGWLTDDGEQTGSAWGVDDLSLKFRRPIAEIERALDFLASAKISWLIIHENNDMPDSHRAVTAQSPPTHLEEKRREEKEGKGKASPPSGFISEVFEAWNELADKAGIPKCLVVSDSRRRQIQARQREPFFIENWNIAMHKISQSKFCKGDNDRGWVATFDWFIKPENFTKLVEGKYDQREQPKPAQRPTHIRDATHNSQFEVIP